MTYNSDFEWDENKDKTNQEKHGVSFAIAQLAFLDHQRIILKDLEHSSEEERFYCLGKVSGGILTVRFTYRSNKIIERLGAEVVLVAVADRDRAFFHLAGA